MHSDGMSEVTLVLVEPKHLVSVSSDEKVTL